MLYNREEDERRREEQKKTNKKNKIYDTNWQNITYITIIIAGIRRKI